MKFTQLSLSDIYDNCKDLSENDKPAFLSLLETYLDISEYIPLSFYKHFYKNFGRKRKYQLESFLYALLIQRIFSIPTDSLLITFLKFSKELREFCGFTKVPDASKFTTFKQNFSDDLSQLFERLVDITEPICQCIDSTLASTLVFDTSGVEAYVTENNPKFISLLIKQLKHFYKNNPSVDPYKMAYGLMPSHASSNPSVKQLYINGHFCYVYKFGLLTNGLGIVRNISFFDDQYLANHPDIMIDKKSDSPDEDKSLSDSKALKPVINDFLSAHPFIKPETFLGDSAFDTIASYSFLLSDCHFSKAVIPLNPRGSTDLPEPGFDESGQPLCPKDASLPMKYEGKAPLRSGVVRYKWVCPKIKWKGNKRVCLCDFPCTPARSGRMVYTYPEKNLRLYPGIIRDTPEWISTYKQRSVIEQTINHFKENMCVANRKTQNSATIKADLLLAGIAQLITVILADKIHEHKLIRSLKPLLA